MKIIKPYIHQSVFIQAPYRITNTRFFFLIGGYACGKTTALDYGLVEAIRYFAGKKDSEGKNPKIGVCGITLTFLKKTFTGAFVSLLQASKSQFNYDKAHNIIYIAGVELHLTPIEDEDAIFGFDWAACFVDELDELPTHKSPLVVKALNDRCRQTIEGCREPFLCFATTSQGLKGTYKTIQNFKKIGMNHFIVRGETKANTSLPRSYVEAMYKIYNDKERACFLEGKFIDVNAGNVYPDYLEGDHSGFNDLYQVVEPHETVYIGQDFNCLHGNTMIATSKGLKAIRNIMVGDEVLTRQGYKKVLTVANKGIKIVSKYGKVIGTKDHVAITPEGDKPLCEAKQFYYLPKRAIKKNTQDAKRLANVYLLNELLSSEAYTQDIHTSKKHAQKTTSTKAIRAYIERFMNTTMVRSIKMTISTINILSMIIALRVSKKCKTQNTQDFMAKNLFIIISTVLIGKILKAKNAYSTTTSQKKARSIIAKQLRLLGKLDAFRQLYNALTAEKSSLPISKLLKDAMNVKRNIEQKLKETHTTDEKKDVQQIKKYIQTVQYAENLLQERIQQNTAKNTRLIGNDKQSAESLAFVYDIEVEDAHEFYANGMLVHNCGFNKAVACIVREGVIYVIKEYNFPDVRRAPEVFRYDFPMNKIKWIPDATSNMSISAFSSEIRSQRIERVFKKSNPLVKDRTFLINKLFYSDRLRVCAFCKELDQALLERQNDPKTGLPMKGKGEDAPDHVCDSLEYVVFHIVQWLREMKDIYDVTIGRRITKRDEAFEEGEDEMLHAIAREDII